MAAQSLREQLLALPGVAEAEIDGEDGAPSGVRIRLAPEADAEAVGSEVQRVLAVRGMRSRVGAGDVPPPLFGPAELEAAAALVPVAASPEKSLQSVLVEESSSGLEVTVVGSDGRRATRHAEVSEEGLVAAVIAAAGMALEGAEPRVLSVEWATVGESRVVTMVLEGAGGRRRAGAGLVRASRGYAVARAAWSALSD